MISKFPLSCFIVSIYGQHLRIIPSAYLFVAGSVSTDDKLLSSPPVSLSRSFSAPPKLDRSISVQEGIHDVRRLQRWRANVQKKHRVRNTDETDAAEGRSFVSTIAEIFSFIGGDPDKAVSQYLLEKIEHFLQYLILV